MLVPSQSVLHEAMDVEVTHKDEKIHLNHYPFLNCLDYVSKYVDITSSMIYLYLYLQDHPDLIKHIQEHVLKPYDGQPLQMR